MTQRRQPYYGWLIVAAFCLTQTTGYGILYYAFTVFIKPMEVDLGWSRTQTTGAFSAALLVGALVAVPIGHILDKYGARLLMTAGSALGALMMLLWSGVAEFPLFVLLQIGLSVAGAASLYEPAFATIAKWFQYRRRQAIVTLTLAAGFASAIFIPLTQWLVEVQGWRTALITLAVLQAVLTIPAHWLFVRRAPAVLDEPPLPDLPGKRKAAPTPTVNVTPREATRQARFWWLTLARALYAMAGTVVTIHMIAYFTESNFAPSFAAALGSIAGFMSFPTRIAYNFLGSRFSQRVSVNVIFGVQFVALVLLFLARTEPTAILFAIFFGISRSIISPAMAVLMAELYGTAHYGTINSVIALAGALAASLSPVGAGWLRDTFGSYNPVLILIIGVSALSVLSINFAVSAVPQPSVPEPLQVQSESVN